jgi:glycosyltransferase involved in cell wall biosynthesis
LTQQDAKPHSVVCAQVGAREHYAIPRALSSMELLHTLLTDLWAGPRWRHRALAVETARRFTTRWHEEIPDERVIAFTKTALWHAAMGLWRTNLTTEEKSIEYLRVGERFARACRRYLARQLKSSSAPSTFFAYTTGALEVLEFLKERGIPTIVDQIDPARAEEEIVCREEELWPGWAEPPGRIPDVYFDRLTAEWKHASIVVVNSEWSQAGLIQQGVPREKLRVLPLAYDTPARTDRAERSSHRKTILWLGQVVLRKGIQYLMAAAKLLPAQRLHFVVAGPIGISDEAVRSAPSNMSFVGPITRDRVPDLYLAGDLFVFPTLSDGFGVTQLEAMAHGLPVIATKNCGQVVEHGVNGLVVPARDPEALAEAIQVVFDDRRLAAMSLAARETAGRFSLQMLSARMRVILNELRAEP